MYELSIVDRVDECIKQLVLDDPVRPEIGVDFRCHSPDNLIFVLRADSQVVAVLCCGFRSFVPSSVEELLKFEYASAVNAIFYSVWSYSKGSGRVIISMGREWIKANLSHISGFYTLSPLGETVRNFHLGLGAIEWRKNNSSVNYKY